MIDPKYTDISIDQMQLDMELSKNIYILKFWLSRITKLTAERDTVKKEIKAREAEIRLEIDENPEGRVRKINNDNIQAVVELDSQMSNLQSDLISVNADLGEAYGYRDLFNERKEAIHHLIKLYLNNYYAEGDHPSLQCYSNRADEQSRRKQVAKDLDKALKKRKKAKDGNY
jgi:hypothetical protein